MTPDDPQGAKDQPSSIGPGPESPPVRPSEVDRDALPKAGSTQSPPPKGGGGLSRNAKRAVAVVVGLVGVAILLSVLSGGSKKTPTVPVEKTPPVVSTPTTTGTTQTTTEENAPPPPATPTAHKVCSGELTFAINNSYNINQCETDRERVSGVSVHSGELNSVGAAKVAAVNTSGQPRSTQCVQAAKSGGESTRLAVGTWYCVEVEENGEMFVNRMRYDGNSGLKYSFYVTSFQIR
jgi:hypothetical protein